jgi:membrane-bound serine protease (ClpP class)
MDLFLNPNIAYLILVAGFLMGLLALVSPGTGVLEISALFAIVLAGYSIYNLPVNLWALGILILAAVPFLYSVRQPGRQAFLIVSIALTLVGSAFLFRGDDWRPAVHPLLAFLASVFITCFLWIVARKTLVAIQQPPSHNLGELIGATGEARTEIYKEGSVYVGGEMWSARSSQPIAPDSPVRVVRRDGLILDVEPVVQPLAQPSQAEPRAETQAATFEAPKP